jgi:hypothetical protein
MLTKPIEDTQKLDGPDYITVVVEWSDDDDAPTLVSNRPVARAQRHERTWVTMLGALSAIALTTWCLRLLKPA